MESLRGYVDELHRKQEEAFLMDDQPSLDAVNAELDEVITDEVLEAMKGEA